MSYKRNCRTSNNKSRSLHTQNTYILHLHKYIEHIHTTLIQWFEHIHTSLSNLNRDIEHVPTTLSNCNRGIQDVWHTIALHHDYNTYYHILNFNDDIQIEWTFKWQSWQTRRVAYNVLYTMIITHIKHILNFNDDIWVEWSQIKQSQIYIYIYIYTFLPQFQVKM